MSNGLRMAIICLCMFAAMSQEVFAGDPCRLLTSDARAKLILKDASLSTDHFVGTFELSNIGFRTSLTLHGKRQGNFLNLDDPDVSVQFLDLNMHWESFTALTGSYLRPDQISVSPHSRAEFTTELMSQEIADKSASEFRVVLRLFNPDICVISQSFHTVRTLQQVTGFEQSRN